MNIQDISIYGGTVGGTGNKCPGASFLGIGNKGDIVQGKVTKVGNHVSLNFNGIEVTVAKGAVRGAREGEVRNFQITDISSDSIVLKEVGQIEAVEAVRKPSSTSVAPSNYSFAECLEASAEVAQAKETASESLSVLNGEDYEKIEQEEGSLAEKTKECVERAVERRKEKKEWYAERQQEAEELRKELREGLAKQQAAGFLAQKSEAQIRNMLQEAGIPVTSSNLEKVVAALGMSQAALDVTDQAKAYIIGQDLEPTIENLYQGRYSALKTVSGNMQDFEGYRQQIEKILEECGRQDEAGRQDAQWLFANELPVNETTLGKLDLLNQVADKMTPDKVLEQIVFAMMAGASPKDAVLDDREFVIARDVIQDFQKVDDSTIFRAAGQMVRNQVENREAGGNSQGEFIINLAFLRNIQNQPEVAMPKDMVIPAVFSKGMTPEEIHQVTLKRQLEEIRQKMTLQSAAAMEKNGIHIETEPLENIIRSLRELENAYYSSQVGQKDSVAEPGQMDLLQETLGKTADIANSHAALLGSGVRRQELLTVNELHAAARSQTANRNDWNGVFEKVSTQARADLGDSIQKAFEGIPALLEEIGLEDTKANERAVRILGYNQAEITKENIEQVKIFDEKVNRVIDNMKPSAVLELIRRGENPLDMPLDELNRELEQIRQEKDISDEERYSRFLWQMEKSGNIDENERKGYIGVYRLLNQLQKTDGAVIGAVMQTGQEMTLGNLLTQARTRKKAGINSVVDDTRGMNEGGQFKNSITEQIREGFSGYYQHLAQDALSEVTPAALKEMTDGDMEKLLHTSLERFCEDLKQASGNQELKKEFFEEQAKELREVLGDSEQAQEYLSNLQIPQTVENLLAATAALQENYTPYKECYGRKNVLPKEKQEKFEEIVDSIEEAIGNPEDLTGKCEEAEKIMGEILTKSYEQADITLEDLSSLRKLGQGIHLQGMLRHSQSYDIPIRTGDTVTSLNLTLIHGSEESGKIQISMEDGASGNISMDFKLAGSRVKGLVLCDQRQGFEALQGQKEALEKALEAAGYQIKNISYGMDFKERNELLNEQVPGKEAGTAQLYQIAKILVRSVAAVVRAGE